MKGICTVLILVEWEGSTDGSGQEKKKGRGWGQSVSKVALGHRHTGLITLYA
jgi:hypothetical protein